MLHVQYEQKDGEISPHSKNKAFTSLYKAPFSKLLYYKRPIQVVIIMSELLIPHETVKKSMPNSMTVGWNMTV